MAFWGTTIAMILIIGGFLAGPVVRARFEDDSEEPDISVYRAQLAEIDRDLARGLLDAETADRTRTEVSRRLIAASKTAGTHVGQGSPKIALTLMGVLVVCVTFITYSLIGSIGSEDRPLSLRLAEAQALRANRPTQAEMASSALPTPTVDAPAEYLASVQELRDVMATRADDPRGWQLLAFHETELRNYSAAAEAQTNLIALQNAPSTEDLTRLIDLMVAATDGLVSPEAETVARQILEIDAENIAARYYIGAMYNQTERPDRAYRIWRPIVEAGDPGFHTALASAALENAAARAGIRYTPPAFTGPDLETIAAAEELSEDERAAMISNMVSGLANKLATQGGTATEWARLIRSYAVLGETTQAQSILQEALAVFAGDPDAMAVLNDVATRTGIAE